MSNWIFTEIGLLMPSAWKFDSREKAEHFARGRFRIGLMTCTHSLDDATLYFANGFLIGVIGKCSHEF